MNGIYSISGYQGDNLSLRLTGYVSGAAADLTSYGLSGYARDSYGATNHRVDFSPIAVSGQELAGVFDLNLHPTGMSSIPVGIYFFDIERYSGQADVAKIAKGKFYVHPEATY